MGKRKKQFCFIFIMHMRRATRGCLSARRGFNQTAPAAWSRAASRRRGGPPRGQPSPRGSARPATATPPPARRPAGGPLEGGRGGPGVGRTAHLHADGQAGRAGRRRLGVGGEGVGEAGRVVLLVVAHRRHRHGTGGEVEVVPQEGVRASLVELGAQPVWEGGHAQPGAHERVEPQLAPPARASTV